MLLTRRAVSATPPLPQRTKLIQTLYLKFISVSQDEKACPWCCTIPLARLSCFHRTALQARLKKISTLRHISLMLCIYFDVHGVRVFVVLLSCARRPASVALFAAGMVFGCFISAPVSANFRLYRYVCKTVNRLLPFRSQRQVQVGAVAPEFSYRVGPV